MCARYCPASAVYERSDSFFIEEERCIGCAQCISVCPQAAVKIIWSESYDELGEKLAEYAYAAVQGKHCFYINVCLYITKECDCMNKEKQGIVKDLGILFSDDPVAVDKACIDLLNEQESRNVLLDIHPKVNYLHYLNYAEKIGLGSTDYKLIKLG
jgi:uncharacterized Fe-S center protein